jgi:superfamily II DNA or RNA helicase
MEASRDTGEQERRAMQAEVVREWVTYREAEAIAGISVEPCGSIKRV